MYVLIRLTNAGGELNAVTIDACDESDPSITEAVKAMAAKGVQVGDTITITEVE